MRRKSIAKSEIGEDYDVGTYPQENNRIEIHENNGVGMLKGVLLGAALLAGGGAASLGLANFLKSGPTVITQPGDTKTIRDTKTIEKVFDPQIRMEVIPPKE